MHTGPCCSCCLTLRAELAARTARARAVSAEDLAQAVEVKLQVARLEFARSGRKIENEAGFRRGIERRLRLEPEEVRELLAAQRARRTA